MASLASLMEDFRNWRGTEDWKLKKLQDMLGNEDPENIALNEKLMGIGTADMPMTAGGLAGIFAGLGSKTAPREAWNKAQLAAKLGKDEAETWAKYGWGKAPWDQQWRYEIPDEAATLKNPEAFNTSWEKFQNAAEKEKYGPRGAQPSQMGRKDYNDYQTFQSNLAKQWNAINPNDSTVGAILNHPELFAAYPELKNLQVKQFDSPSTLKGYLKDSDLLGLYRGLTPEEARSTLMHELQHWVQNKEKFAPGGGLEDFTNTVNPETGQYHTIEEAYDKYRKLGGEAESRLTQKRLDYGMPMQRALIYPYTSSQLDVPINSIINAERAPGFSLTDLLRR